MTDDPMDIVSRLRRTVREERGYKNLQMHCVEAADEIERLRARIKELELDVEASEADRHFHDDFYTPPEDNDD